MSPADNDVAKSPTLAQLTPSARSISLDYWEAGYVEGHAAGWAAAWDRMRADAQVQPLTDADQRTFATQAAKAIDYPTLLERRGEHTKAARYRAAYRLLGILPCVIGEVGR